MTEKIAVLRELQITSLHIMTQGECFVMAQVKALIACRSVTYAQRAVRILSEAGLRTSMRRLPSDLPDTGCGHAVRVDMDRLEEAMTLMNNAGFPTRTYFCEEENGGVIQCP